MSERFDYPTYAAPTKSLVFERGGGGSNGRLSPGGESMVGNVVSDRTAAGTLLVESMGSPYKQVPFTVRLPYSHATYTDYADFEEFFDEDHALMGVNTFEWTDKAGTLRTVRLADSTYTMEYDGPNTVQVTFTIEEVS